MKSNLLFVLLAVFLLVSCETTDGGTAQADIEIHASIPFENGGLDIVLSPDKEPEVHGEFTFEIGKKD